MMSKEEEDEEETTTPPSSTPPADLRCLRYDGKGWYCKGWRLQDKSFCQKHYFENLSKKEEKNQKKEKKFEELDEVGKPKLQEKFDLDDGVTKRVKENGVGSEDGEERGKIEIILSMECDNKKEKIDLGDSISNGVKENRVDCKCGEEVEKIEMIPLQECRNKKNKSDLDVKAVNGVKDEKEKTELRRSKRSSVGRLKRNYREESDTEEEEEEEDEVSLITVMNSDNKSGKNDLDGVGDTSVNNSSKGKKPGRGRPKKVEGISNGVKDKGVESEKEGKIEMILLKGKKLVVETANVVEEEAMLKMESVPEREKSELGQSKRSSVGGLKRNYREESDDIEEEENVEMITVKQWGKNDLGGGGGTLVNVSSNGKRGRGRPKKVEGISNGVKEKEVESEEGGKIEMKKRETHNFGGAGGDTLINDSSKGKKRGRPKKVELGRNYREGDEVEMITVKESDKKWGESVVDGSYADTAVNDSSNEKNEGRPTEVEGGPIKEFEHTKSTSKSSLQMRHWLIIKQEKELEMKTAIRCGTMSTGGRNENLTTENESTEEETNEDCKKRHYLDDGGATVVKDSLNAVKSKAELLEGYDDKINDFAGGSENLSSVLKDNLPRRNDDGI